MLSFVVCMLIPAALAAAVPQSFTIHIPDLNTENSARLLAADSTGKFFVISASPRTSAITNIHVTKTDLAGGVIASFDFGSTGVDTPTAATVDAQGNLIVVGATRSTDFPLISPLIKTGIGFATKIDAELHQILFSTRLGSIGGGPVTAGATAVALDPAGNIYITGSTSTGFPTTLGVLQPQAPLLSQAGTISHGFVMELSASGDRVVFSTYFSGADFVCATGQNPCFLFQPPANFSPPAIATTPSAIAVDATGSIVLGGTSNSSNLPVSTNAFATKCACTNLNSTAFVAVLSAGATRLNWGTYVPAPPPMPLYAPSIVGVPLDTIASLSLDASGNVIFAGSAAQQFPISTGTLQTTFPSPSGYIYAGYVAKLDSTGSKLLFGTWLGAVASPTEGPSSVTIDREGVIWVTGTAATGTLPSLPETPLLGDNFILALSPDGRSALSLFTVPDGAAGAAIQATAAGAIGVLGTSGSLLISASEPAPSLLGVVGSASTTAANALASRELISLFGIGIGPAIPLTASVTGGIIPKLLSGVQVLFDGVPAALLYAGPNQINAIVPSAAAGRATTAIAIVTPTGTILGPTFRLQPTLPAVLTNGHGYAIAINQDGTMNSSTNPATTSSVVSIWMIGGGAATNTPDNIVNTTNLRGNVYPVSILTINSQEFPAVTSLEVLYAGDAPGAPSGVTQVNFLLPAWIRQSYQVQIGSAMASFQIYVGG